MGRQARRDSLDEHRAAEHEGRIVSIGPLVLFSTDTGDAWILDPADQLAARLAYDGDALPVYIEDPVRRLKTAEIESIAVVFLFLMTINIAFVPFPHWWQTGAMSLLVAFTLDPMLSSRFVRFIPEEERTRTRMGRLFERWGRAYDRLDAKYHSVLGWSLDRL